MDVVTECQLRCYPRQFELTAEEDGQDRDQVE